MGAVKKVSTPRKAHALPSVRDWHCHVVYILNDERITFGFLKPQVAYTLLREGYRGASQQENDFTPDQIDQFSVPLVSLPSLLPPVGDARGDGYLLATQGKGVIPDLELRLRRRLAKPSYSHLHTPDVINKLLDETSRLREKDNIFHLYALFAHYPHFSGLMERLFLWFVTDSGPGNKHGVMVTAAHVAQLCDLMNMERAYGLPVIHGERPSTPRSSGLDLSHIITDLVEALYKQNLTGTFVRPLAPSLQWVNDRRHLQREIRRFYQVVTEPK